MSIAFLLTVAGVGVVHTVLEPNHYLPFVIIAKVRSWNLSKTLGVTFLCGLAHIVSSMALGMLGVGLGVAVSHIEVFDGYRANIAAWALILFGLIYMVWGIRQALSHGHGSCNHHHHDGLDESKAEKRTVWSLVLIFLITPCEVWLPLMMFPAIQNNMLAVAGVAFFFSLSTIAAMFVLVTAGYYGAGFLPVKKVQKYGHAVGGFIILLCGVVMQVLSHTHGHVH